MTGPKDILKLPGLYRDTVAAGDTLASDTANFGNLPWREVSSLTLSCKRLIEQGTELTNTDLLTASTESERGTGMR